MVDLAEMERNCPIKHKILLHKFQIHPTQTGFPVERQEDESGAWQQRLNQLNHHNNTNKWASSSEFRKLKREALQGLPNSPHFGTEGSAGLPKLPSLPFSESGSQSNTNSKSSESIIFRIDTNQTHPDKTNYSPDFH